MKTVTSNKGGKRPGAGRKRGEPTVVVRVPVGVLAEVQALVRQHKEGTLKSVTESTAESVSNAVAPKVQALGVSPDADAGRPVESVDLKTVRKQLECLPRAEKRRLYKEYGSLDRAAEAGIRAEGKRAVLVS
jgi:hypothetical protein